MQPSHPAPPRRPIPPGVAPVPVLAERPPPWVAPPWTPRATEVLRAARLPKEKRSEVVRAAVAITKAQERAWVIACVVRAALDGKRAGEEFDLNKYVAEDDLMKKGPPKK